MSTAPLFITPIEPDRDRLHRLAQWCVTGRLAAAELELYDWQKSDDCPVTARTLLAALFARRGADDDALDVLRRAHRAPAQPDADLIQLHISVLAAAGLAQTAHDLVLQLHQSHGHDAAIAAWINTMNIVEAAEMPQQADPHVARLAAELTFDPQVIPRLVVAQKIQPVASDIQILRQAIACLTRDMRDDHPRMLMICQSMADLAMLAKDTGDARQWAQRGLGINPFAASLALVLSQISSHAAPSTADVLQSAIQANPAYPDLRAALVRHHMRLGQTDQARLYIQHWLSDQPGQPLATQLQQELAA